jgi:hypothetical protein
VAIKLPTISLPFAKKATQPDKRPQQKSAIRDASESVLDDFVQTTIIAGAATTAGPVTLQADTINAIDTSAGGSKIRTRAKQGFKLPVIGLSLIHI